MSHGVNDNEIKTQAELSERLLPIDKWTDIPNLFCIYVILKLSEINKHCL